MTKKILLLFFLLLVAVSFPLAYTVTTTNVTNYIVNNNFDSFYGWHAVTTSQMTFAGFTTCYGRTGIYLRSFYTNTTKSYPATIKLYSPTATDYNPVTLVDANTTAIARDAILVKVRMMGVPSITSGLVCGNFTVKLQGALSCCTDFCHHSVPYSSDTQIFETGGYQVSPSQCYFGLMTTWSEYLFTFIPQGQCDWWQVRDIQLSYEAMATQPYPTGVLIDLIEMYAIRVDEQ
jgi:hypothetical protein